MPTEPRSATVRSRSVYRMVRVTAKQTRGVLRERGIRGTWAAAARRFRGGHAEPRAAALAAATAVFRAGEDDELVVRLATLERRFPYSAAVLTLKADLLAHQGDYAGALAAARTARIVEPARADALSRTVRAAYLALNREEADEIAIDALRRMPRSSTVLWAVGKGCATPEQAHRVITTWRECVPDQRTLPKAARQLASAAARARCTDLATEVYRDAIVALHARNAPLDGVRTKQLMGKGAWQAIEDLTDALDSAGVPFFFAAGTALGLVREGRPLDLDGDIDIGVFDADWDRERLVEIFRKDPRFVPDPNPMSIKVAIKHRGGSPIDIFRYYDEDGKVWHDGVFVRWWNTPFGVVRQDIRGLSLPLPDNDDLYLTENYGDWRTPNPGYDVFTEAPNFELHWPEYAHMHLLRRAYIALCAGDRANAIADLKTAGESELVTLLNSDPEAAPAVQTGPVDEVLVRVRALAADGDHAKALAELDGAIRDRRWKRREFWAELPDLVHDEGAAAVIRSLWLDSPAKCATNVGILRAVGVAAARAGDHELATALLRKATLIVVRRSRRSQTAVRGAVQSSTAAAHTGTARDASRDEGPAPIEAHVELLDAVIDHRQDGIRRSVGMLVRSGDAGWLNAL